MGVRLSEDEAWAVVERAHTATVTTLRRDGWPISLPVWFTVIDRRIYLRTPARSKKVARVLHDPRACFQVESGTAWSELRAVVMPVLAHRVQDEELIAEISKRIGDKYKSFTTAREEMPKATREHYEHSTAYIALTPTGRILSWDNARINLGAAR